MMEARGVKADKATIPLTSPQQAIYTMVGPSVVSDPIDDNRGLTIACSIWLAACVVSGKKSSMPRA